MKKIKIGALISGGGTNLQAILDACEQGEISGKMSFVGSDNHRAAGLKRAESRRIPDFVVDYDEIVRKYRGKPIEFETPDDFNLDDILSRQRLFPKDSDSDRMRFFFLTRAIAEQQILDRISEYPCDLLVLAGFMRILTPWFIDRFNPSSNDLRIMNIHPALLPMFPGTDGYGDTFRYGCRVGGCTVHFVDYGEDTGPIIGQRAFPISSDDSLDIVKSKGLKEEWKLYPECIQLFAEGRLKITRKKHILHNGRVFEKTVVDIC